MKKNFISITVLLSLIVGLLSACQPAANPGAAAQPKGLKVLAAESFLADIAQNVAGDRVTVDTLMPLGIDPHTFEPTPRDLAKIDESNVLIINGAGFEEWLNRVINNAGGQRSIVEASAGLTSRDAREGEAAEMSAEEKAEAYCVAAKELKTGGEQQAGADAASAPALTVQGDAPQIQTLQLNAASQNSGFLKLTVEEAGDVQISAAAGQIQISDASGKPVEAEDTLAVDCAGFKQAITAELEPGEYQVELSGFASTATPFLAAEPLGGHHHHQGDPHFWLDPISVVQYTKNIRDGLIQADPEGKAVYTANADAYIAKLTQLDEEIRKEVSAIPQGQRRIVTNHESFGYFADRYDFKIIGTIIPSVSSGATPSAQQLARLMDRIKATHATVIFLETGSNPALAEQIASATGVKVVSDLYTHSITEPGGKAPTYIDMMKYNTRVIVDALK